MDVGDVEPLQEVVAVEGPVGAHQVVARAGGVEHGLAQRHPGDPRVELGRQLGERERGVERGEEELPPVSERDLRQVVGGGGEAFGALELGHREEAAVVGEAPAVIAAAERRLHPGVLADQRAAVGADVRQAVEAVLRESRVSSSGSSSTPSSRVNG